MAAIGAVEMFGLSLNHRPVSYTHLDVYKRQGYTPNVLQTGAMPGQIWEGHIKRTANQNVPIPVEVKKLEARRHIKKCAEERMGKFNAEHQLVSFKTGESVLLHALIVGKTEDNTAA